MKNIKKCSIEGCERKYRCKNYCDMHYWRVQHHGHPGSAEPIFKKDKPTICSVNGCERVYYLKGFCSLHYSRNNICGDPGEIERRKAFDGNGSIKNGYHILYINGKEIPEHRLVFEQYLDRKLTKKENVHHKNGDRLDNRIENLELWSTKQPYGQRVEDKIKFAKEILAQYENIKSEDDAHYW